MDIWFTEHQTPTVLLGLKVEKILWREQTPYQELVVAQSEAFGRMLVLDGAVQTTIGDEFVYHEMIAHVPLATHPNPRKVAVIGGGDGGAIREILKHPGVQEAHLVEIDQKVVDASRRYLPEISAGLDDPRAFVHFTDGIEWVRQARDFDVIIVDSTDPVGPAEGLFSPAFYRSIAEALGDDGVMVAQSESPFLQGPLIQRIYRGVSEAFLHTRLYLANVPTYPSGLWSFTMGSKKPVSGVARPDAEDIVGRYWSPAVHAAAFQLPPFVEALLR